MFSVIRNEPLYHFQNYKKIYTKRNFELGNREMSFSLMEKVTVDHKILIKNIE